MGSPESSRVSVGTKLVGRSLLVIMLAACTPSSREKLEEPDKFRFPSGTVFLAEPTADATPCGTLTTEHEGTRVQLQTYRDAYGTSQITYGGYAATELGICVGDSDGVIWHNEGLQQVPVPPIH